MHLLADMGCPVHVRNDSHAPSMALGVMGDPDPYESYMAASVVTLKKDGPAEPGLKTAFSNAVRAEDLFETLSVFTNENFFTNQTISGMGVEQISPIIDDQPAYPQPKLGGLEYIAEEFTFYKTFSSGTKVKMCKDHSYFWFRGYPYIDSDCADSQADVLIPNILEGGVHLMRLFIPQLKVEIEEIDTNEGYIRGTVTHTTDDEYQTPIYYTGPVDIFMDWDKIATVEADGGDFEGDIPGVPEGKEVSAQIHFGGITVASEKKKPALTANWEMLLWFDDRNNEYYPANVIRIDDWVPATVGADGRVTVDYTFADPRYLINLSDTHTVTHHIKGSGTYLDNRLEIKGTWSTDAKWEYPSGSCIKTGFQRVNGSFTLAGKHSSGFFFNDSKTSQATASVVWEEIETCYDAEGEVTNTYKEDYSYSDLTPHASVDEFQRK